MKVIYALALALFLSACQTMDYQGADAGTVAMGIGATNPAYPSYMFHFRKIGEKDGGDLKYKSDDLLGINVDKSDYENAKEKGIIRSLKLAPGSYEIYNFMVFSPTAMGYAQYWSKDDFSIPFTIVPGKITYLGNYQANMVYGENMLGMRVPAGAIFRVSDRENTDMALLKKRVPNDAALPVINAKPNVKSINNPFIVE